MNQPDKIIKVMSKSSLVILSTLFLIARNANSQENALPKIDLHVHISKNYGGSPDLRYQKAAELSTKLGVIFGIAEEIETPDIRKNDELVNECILKAKKYPLFIGLQVNQPGWTKLYSKSTIDNLDYILADALRFPDNNGKIILLWTKGVNFADIEDFMDRYVDYHLKVFAEPIDVWVNATFLPESFSAKYDELWTEKRMKTLINAAVKKNIAIEINSRYRIPWKKFIQLAKAAGAKFTFGSNNHDEGIGDIEWCQSIAKECGLKKSDFFMPSRKLSLK
jgi:hypothetical protein